MNLFEISNHAPQSLQDLYQEAVGCFQNNYLTGATACILLFVTDLAELMEVEGYNFEERLEGLRDNTNAETEYFDRLLSLNRYETSDAEPISYDGWGKSQLQVMLETLSTIMEEYYPV